MGFGGVYRRKGWRGEEEAGEQPRWKGTKGMRGKEWGIQAEGAPSANWPGHQTWPPLRASAGAGPFWAIEDETVIRTYNGVGKEPAYALYSAAGKSVVR